MGTGLGGHTLYGHLVRTYRNCTGDSESLAELEQDHPTSVLNVLKALTHLDV